MIVRTWFRTLVLAVLLSAFVATTATAQVYGRTDLGTLGGAFSTITAVNAHGMAVGYSETADHEIHAFAWTAERGMVDLGVGWEGHQSRANAVADNGMVVGWTTTQGQTADFREAVLWWPNLAVDLGISPVDTMYGLGKLSNGNFSDATAANASEQIVGIADNGSGETHAFFFSPATRMVEIPTGIHFGSPSLFGSTASFPTAMNAGGQVVGGAFAPDQLYHAFLWSPGEYLQDLGALGPDRNTIATGIDAHFQIVGTSEHHYSMRAFSWTFAGGIVDLGTLFGGDTAPAAVNASGQVVGVSYAPDALSSRAFSVTPGGPVVDLGTLSGRYTAATAVGASGQVVGVSLVSSGYHGFSWTAAGGMVDLDAGADSTRTVVGVDSSGQVYGEVDFVGDGVHDHATIWRLRPVLTLTVPSLVATTSLSGGSIGFTVSSPNPIDVASCTADGLAFTSGGVLALGSHTITCTATDSSTGLSGSASANTTVVLAGPAGLAGATGATGATGAKGDKGDTGAKGDKGDTGGAGAKGDKGDPGADGAPGATGAAGAQGAAGAKGDKGDPGADGAPGATGAAGTAGADGAKGDAGATGATGAAGAKGDTGDPGATGPAGSKGDTGATGAQGAKGDTGATGATGAGGPQGPAGPQGPVGPQGPSGGGTAVTGSLVLMPEGMNPGAGYVRIGSYREERVDQDGKGGKKPFNMIIVMWQKQ